MSETDQYIKELTANANLARKRLSAYAVREKLSTKAEGEWLNDYLDSRISELVNKMTGSVPLDDRAYLDSHGAVKELQLLKRALSVDPSELKSLNEEIETYERTIEDLNS